MAEGQIITLPGIIATVYGSNGSKKCYIPFDNISLIIDRDGYTEIIVKEAIPESSSTPQTYSGKKTGISGLSVIVEEPISNLLSPVEMAKFSVEFGSTFIREMSEKIKIMQQLRK